MVEKYTIIGAEIWLEVIIVLKGMFKIKLAFLFAFKRVNFARQAFVDTFSCPPNF